MKKIVLLTVLLSVFLLASCQQAVEESVKKIESVPGLTDNPVNNKPDVDPSRMIFVGESKVTENGETYNVKSYANVYGDERVFDYYDFFYLNEKLRKIVSVNHSYGFCLDYTYKTFNSSHNCLKTLSFSEYRLVKCYNENEIFESAIGYDNLGKLSLKIIYDSNSNVVVKEFYSSGILGRKETIEYYSDGCVKKSHSIYYQNGSESNNTTTMYDQNGKQTYNKSISGTTTMITQYFMTPPTVNNNCKTTLYLSPIQIVSAYFSYDSGYYKYYVVMNPGAPGGGYILYTFDDNKYVGSGQNPEPLCSAKETKTYDEIIALFKTLLPPDLF